MASGDKAVSWQAEPCPSWCVVTHQEGDPVADRLHEDGGRTVPVRVWDPTGAEVREFHVSIHRRDGTSRTWIYIGDGWEQRVEIDVVDIDDVVSAVHSEQAELGG